MPNISICVHYFGGKGKSRLGGHVALGLSIENEFGDRFEQYYSYGGAESQTLAGDIKKYGKKRHNIVTIGQNLSVTPEQLDDFIAVHQEMNHQKYNLLHHNCAQFAQKALKKGFNIQIMEKKVVRPITFYKQAFKYSKSQNLDPLTRYKNALAASRGQTINFLGKASRKELKSKIQQFSTKTQDATALAQQENDEPQVAVAKLS